MDKKFFLAATMFTALCTNVHAFGLGAIGLGGGSEKVGEEQKVPVSERIQTVDYAFVKDIVAASDNADYLYVKTFKRFATPAVCIEAVKEKKEIPPNCEKKGRGVQEVSLGNLKGSDPELYELVRGIMLVAAEEFKSRKVPEKSSNEFFRFLTKSGIDDLTILMVKTRDGEDVTSARYFPEGKVGLLGVRSDKLTDPGYRAEIGFLIAHEVGHALGLHVLEDKTAAADVTGRIADKTEIGMDLAIDQLYAGLDSGSTQLVDSAAQMLSGFFLGQEDLAKDHEVMKARSESSAVVMAKKFGQGDKVRLLGADLRVPSATRVVIKKMMKSGMEATQVIELLKNGTDSAAYMLNAASHSKDQEFEADNIGFYLAQKVNLDSSAILSFLDRKAASEQGGGSLIGGHPSMKDRIEKLKDTYKL